ncbi:MAG TPA: HEAT repeat domain-containing protein [Clostridia bacterium]|nr:HEAT repeat domain-containing protein [Clostridia bacterium]
MRKVPIIGFFAILLFGVAGWVSWQISSEREPYYQGKPLSFWVDQYAKDSLTPGTPARNEAETAIYKIGTNALPVLMDWCTKLDSAFKLKLVELCGNQAVVNFRFLVANTYHTRAKLVFQVLGAEAKAAVPGLVKLLERPEEEIRINASYALMCIGPEAEVAVPSLVRCLEDTNSLVRGRAARGLGRIHKQPEMVVPALLRVLDRGGSTSVKIAIIKALADFGEDAKPAVPRLRQLMESTDAITRSEALKALQRINPHVKEGALINSEDDRF